jgi:Tat protein translocase TatB subunit
VFSVGPGELVMIFLVALVFLGPRRLPEIARQIGRFTYEMRKVADSLRSTLEDEVREEERQKRLAELRDRQAATAKPGPQLAPPEPRLAVASAELPPGAADVVAPPVLAPAPGTVAREPASLPAERDEVVTDPGRAVPLGGG